MGSEKISLTEFAGLVTAPGLMARNPASCISAINWEFPAPGVMRKRRGNQRLDGSTGGPVWKLLTSRLMASSLLAHVGVGTSGTQLRYGDGTVNLTALTTIDAGALTRPRETRMQMALCQKNHYVTATEGLARLESDFATVATRYAGMPRGLGPQTIAVTPGTNMGDGFARAYRVTWHRKDADDIELGGAPTSRWVVANAAYNTGHVPAGSCSVVLEIQIPTEFGTLGTALATDYYWRLWGTRTYVEATQLGDDEMHLITEAYLTAGDLVNGFVAYTDSTPDAFLLSSPTLHTNLYNFPPAEAGLRQGVVNEDAPPPVCNDVAYWQDVMWFADCYSRPSITVGCIAALADGDTITVTANGVATVVTARNAPGTSDEFQIVTTASTTALNIRQTVMYMCRALNQTGVGNGWSAHAVSTTSTQPGLVYLELARPDADPLIFNSSALAKWQGFGGYAIPSNVSIGSESNVLKFSKQLRADAVPPINVLTAGPADSRILRIVPLRDRLFVFTDYGIFQVTGRTFADFAVYPFDLGYRLMGREFVAQCDERLYAWCLEGIVEIDDGGVRVISAPIEPTIEAALVTAGASSLSTGRTCFAALGYATAYRNQHQVRFHYPQANDSTNLNGCAYWLSFDTRTRCWAQGKFSERETPQNYQDNRSCAVVRFTDDLLAFGNWSLAGDTRLFLERRAYASTDFIDTTLTGTSDPVKSVARFQYQVPDDSGAQHWQQTVINWDAEEISWRPLPTSIDIIHGTEAVVVANQTVSVSELATRIEPPQDARRGQRLFVTLTHEIAEYVGIVALEQAFRGGSRFARKVTP